MKSIEWNTDLATGINQIDAQHKMLIQCLKDISEAVSSNKGPEYVLKTLNFLDEYARFHFDAEEMYMDMYKYPQSNQHQKEHQSFLEIIEDLREEFKEDGATHRLYV